MSRIGYSDEEDYPGQFQLWRANLARSLRGRKGQQALRDLREALLAMPEKRLIAHHLAAPDGVCANGALIAHKRKLAEDASWDDIVARMREEYAPACAECYHDKAQHGLTCTGCDRDIAKWADATVETAPLKQYGDRYAPKQCPGYDGSLMDDEDDQDMAEDEAAKVGVPKMVAWAIVEQNDDLGGYAKEHVWIEAEKRWEYTPETPEQRYDRVLKWVEMALKNPVAAAGS